MSNLLEDDIAELTKWFHYWDDSARYATLKSECEASCTHWRWASSGMYYLEPLFCEKYKIPKGRWARNDADNERKQFHHGLDENGRVHVIRDVTGDVAIVGRVTETFFRYLPSLIEEISYRETGEIESFRRMDYCNGLPFRWSVISKIASRISSYQYVDGRLVAERSVSMGGMAPKPQYGGFQFSYDSSGQLDSITLEDYDTEDSERAVGTEVVYRRPKKGETVAQLAAKLSEMLESEIPEVLRRAQICEQVYCLLLAYDAENDPLPPYLGLGRESDRARIVANLGRKAKGFLWNPAEDMIFNRDELALTSGQLVEACFLLNQYLREKRGGIASAVKLLDSVCKSLMSFEWNGILHVTDDFVIASVDLEGGVDVLKSLKRTVPPELVANLRRRNLV